jgi:septal ring factor EnvC (AmiA/AmiB activator)
MQAARALKMVSESIKKESESIAQQINELEELKKKVTAERDELNHKQAKLAKEREALDQQVKQRAALEAKLGREQAEEARKLAALAKRASDLKDLVESIQEKQEESRSRSDHNGGASDKETEAMRERLRSFANAMGHIRQPAPGHVVQWFGHGHGQTNKGIIIATRAHSQVVAPFDGEVVYAGTFLNYGQMVIIRHNDDFHTLLAGLAKITVEAGDFLLEGEPIGAMGESGSGNRLYIELRNNNQPVDPAPWIKGIKK